MRIYKDDNDYRKVYVWNDEIPFETTENQKINISFDTEGIVWNEGTISIEAKLNPRHISNYGMLCMNYKHNQNGKVNIIINYNAEMNNKTETQLFNKNAIIGLSDEFAEILKNIFCDYSFRLPSGTIEIISGAYDEVGSSYASFEKIFKLLSFLFQNKEVIEDTTINTELLNLL